MRRIRFLAPVVVLAAVFFATSPAHGAGRGTTVDGRILTGPSQAPAASARGGTFTFYGSGDGHGIHFSDMPPVSKARLSAAGLVQK